MRRACSRCRMESAEIIEGMNQSQVVRDRTCRADRIPIRPCVAQTYRSLVDISAGGQAGLSMSAV